MINVLVRQNNILNRMTKQIISGCLGSYLGIKIEKDSSEMQ